MFGYDNQSVQSVTVTSGQTTPASFTLSTSSTPASAEITPFGMCALLRQMWGYETYPTVLQLAVEAGVKWTRADFTWSSFETSKGVYDTEFLEFFDDSLEQALNQGINVYGLIAYNNSWSSGENSPSTAAQRQDYADFVTYLVNRYGDRIQYWEIWNEPESSEFWKPEPDYSDYFELLKVAYTAAKAANPDVKIISAGSCHEEMIEELFGMGMNDYIDIVGIHPYTYPQPIEQSFWGTAISDFNTLSGGKPIWVTEIGVPTHTGITGSSEAMQAKFLPRIYMTLLALGAQNVTWYDMVDDGPDLSNKEYNFGILRNDYTVKPAYYAYKHMASLLDGKAFTRNLSDTDARTAAALFVETGESTLAVWSFDETLDSNEQVVSVTDKDVTISISGTVSGVTDISGESYSSLIVNGTTISGTVSNSPVYITGDFTVSSFSAE